MLIDEWNYEVISFFLIKIEKDACRFYAYLKKILIKIGYDLFKKKYDV